MDRNLALCVSPQFEVIGRITLRLLVTQANGTVRYESQKVFYSGMLQVHAYLYVSIISLCSLGISLISSHRISACCM